jgi:hypothetical protein
MDKIIGAGHSLGGGTILETGNNDDRIKMVLAMDPVGITLQGTIGGWSALHQKFVQIQNTEQIYNVEPRNIKIHGPGIYDKMTDENTGEFFILEKCDHMHQGDMMAITPLELDMSLDSRFKEEKFMFDPRKRELQLYFCHL